MAPRRNNKDPLKPRPIDKMMGAAALSRGSDGRSWEAGTVVAYHVGTHSADVRTNEGRLLPDVPQLRSGPRSVEMLEPGTDVVISWDLGFTPVIVGCFEPGGRQVDSPLRPSLTGVPGLGDDNPLQPIQGRSNYRPADAPSDLMAGDFVRYGTEGQAIGVLNGGIAHLGSPNALVQSLGLTGLLRLVAQRMQAVTDFGWWKVENDGGKTSFILRAGSNQQTETGVGEEHWTIRLDLGASGGLFNFEITDNDGRPLFRMHVDPDGHLQFYGKGGTEFSSGKSGGSTERHEGDRYIDVDGNDTTSVGGSQSIDVRQSLAQNVGGDASLTVGNDRTATTNRDEVVSVGGVRNEVISGGPSSKAKKGNIAISTTVLNGGWEISLGDPAKGANVSAQAGWALRTQLGDVSIESGGKIVNKANGKMELDGASIDVGQGASHPLPLFDTFLRDLGRFLQTLLIALSAGTQGGPTAQTLTGLQASQALLNQFVSNVLSAQQYTSTKVKNA